MLPGPGSEVVQVAVVASAVPVVNIYPSYKKPFDLIFARAKNEEWRARGGSNSRPCAPEAHALSI
jgi:hypothetical protein